MNKRTLKQREASNKRWRDTHKQHARYLANKTKARTFVRHYATPADIRELMAIWKKRKERDNK